MGCVVYEHNHTCHASIHPLSSTKQKRASLILTRWKRLCHPVWKVSVSRYILRRDRSFEDFFQNVDSNWFEWFHLIGLLCQQQKTELMSTRTKQQSNGTKQTAFIDNAVRKKLLSRIQKDDVWNGDTVFNQQMLRWDTDFVWWDRLSIRLNCDF